MQEQRSQMIDLILTEANIHLKMGNKDKFKTLMEEATSKDPNNADLHYNLGVIAAEAGDNDAAKVLSKSFRFRSYLCNA